MYKPGDGMGHTEPDYQVMNRCALARVLLLSFSA